MPLSFEMKHEAIFCTWDLYDFHGKQSFLLVTGNRVS